MEKKSLYREFFPGYSGHIPLKSEVIGMTVGATNEFIKSSLTKEPDYSQTFIPSNMRDYTFYNKGYFNKDMAKNYPLEEDKIFSNRSKEARTWICGSKYQLYPEHIPGYTGHVSGIETTNQKGSNLFGLSYAKGTSKAIKGDYVNDTNLPVEERYTSVTKASFVKPKMRSDEEEAYLNSKKEEESNKQNTYFEQLNKATDETKKDDEDIYANMSDAFKRAINYNKKSITEVSIIVIIIIIIDALCSWLWRI